MNVHQRPVEIFGCSPDIPFAGNSRIECGEFYVLSPIQERPVYANFDYVMLSISHCWRLLKIAEITEVMRQRGDQELIRLLNNIRTGNITENDKKILKSRFIEKSDHNYCNEAPHIWAENGPVEKCNNKKYLIHCLVENTGCQAAYLTRLLRKFTSLTKTGGLAHKLTKNSNIYVENILSEMIYCSNLSIAQFIRNIYVRR